MPNPVVNPTIITSRVPIPFPSTRGPALEVLQLRVAMPKCRYKPSSPREDATEAPMGKVAVPKGALVELIEL